MLPDNAGDAADARENTHRSRQPTSLSLTDGAFDYSTDGGDELLAPALTCEPVKAAAIDVREFIRFFLSGVTATVGNMAAVWLTRRFLPFETALLAGIAAGITISFALSKIFAFRSRPWNRAVGEATRFLIVYAAGCSIYWALAIFVRRFLVAHGAPLQVAEPAAILAGAGSMMVTSNIGHRFFTYRTYQRAKHSQNTL
jgi:putative flippase GtrA